MSRWSGKLRFVKLMNEIGYRGRDDWDETTAAEYILPFMTWLQNHEQYILDNRARQTFHAHFFTDDKTRQGREYFQALKLARTALASVYMMEEDRLLEWQLDFKYCNDGLSIVDNIAYGYNMTVSEKLTASTMVAYLFAVVIRLIINTPDTADKDLHAIAFKVLRLCLHFELLENAHHLVQVMQLRLENIDMQELESREKDIRKELYKKYGNNQS